MVKSGYFDAKKCDRDRSSKIAKKEAGKKLLVIHGGEISRGMPPGHWNCLFIKDNGAICAAAEANDHDHVLAMEGGLKEAHAQGGFTMWNHPNWAKQAPNETIMWKSHKEILKEGLMDAIEIFNGETGYSPEAHDWCLKYNLAIMGCSDSHAPFFTKIDHKGGQHRVVTLLFATERSSKGVREAIEAVGMADFIGRDSSSLSDGERQRIMVARAIAQQTPIILLDEPTAFLDIPTRFSLCRLLQRLAHEQKKCILFSTHDIDAALPACDEVVVIENEQLNIVERCAATEYLSHLFGLDEASKEEW
jgi:ABC-type dipeptide/oligopeptide/nickel transport system ATPase subunit